MLNFFAQLLQTDGFVARCFGDGWLSRPGLVQLHLVSDTLIWLASLAFPAILLYFAWRRRIAFPWIFWMFGALFVSCGFTRFCEVVLFEHPVSYLSGAVKLLTAVLSWATVLGLLLVVPRVSALRTPGELEREITERRESEESWRKVHSALERRVEERTAELEAANAALDKKIAELERIEAERENLLLREQRARAEAEEASRMKDEFLATLSHELRTPLTAMLGWVHLLRNGQLESAQVTRALEVLDRNTRAQALLINDLLDVSRIVTGKLRLDLRPVSLAPIIHAALETVRPAAEARTIEWEVQIDPKVGVVSGDATRLQQVVWNLLSNAVKFTPRGGQVAVGLEARGDEAVLRVRDNGQGLTAELVPHVFERFRQGDSTTTRVHGGLGLGLAIVRHLVEMHGGTVEASSPGKGQGSTFTVKLPLLRGERYPAHPAGSRVDGATAPGQPLLIGLRVLLVEDEADTRDLLTLVLTRQGAQVVGVGSASEALAKFDQQAPDVLVSDIGLPGEDGFSLIRKIRGRPAARGGRVPAVALTAFAHAEDRIRALEAGFQIHAPKPVDADELVAIVASLGQPQG
jgi:signal transduction histidine kinase